jgi:TPR repeat protein
MKRSILRLCFRSLSAVLIAAVSANSIEWRARAQAIGVNPETISKANAGDAASEAAIGLAYAGGNGVAQDFTKAADWLRKAADQDNGVAEAALGLLYYSGRGVPQDYSKAAELYRKAADKGIAKAELSLGILYRDGQGVSKDYGEALDWFNKAANQGDAEAEYSLALLYDDGKGVPQDTSKAVTFYRRASAQGLAQAQINLGLILFANAGGRPRTLEESYFWLDLAAARATEAAQQEAAAKARDAVASQILPFQLKRTQKRVEKWVLDHPAAPPTSSLH